MKTTMKKLLIVALMLGTITTYSNTMFNASGVIDNENNKVSVSVKDASGTIIYLSLFKHKVDASKKILDYSLLKNGLYTIEIENQYLIELQSFEVYDTKVEFINASKKTIFKPILKQEDSKIFISKVALDSNEMKIDLYYENELIHTETVSSDNQIIKRTYQLDKAEKGEYYAVLKCNGRVYTETFTL